MKAKFIIENKIPNEIEKNWEDKNQQQLDVDDGKYDQLCIWPATEIGDHPIEEFINFMKNELGARIKFEQEVVTLPDNTGPGGRHDLFFYVHTDDIVKFALDRIPYGIRWWEDVIQNNSHKLYPQEILDKYKATW